VSRLLGLALADEARRRAHRELRRGEAAAASARRQLERAAADIPPATGNHDRRSTMSQTAAAPTPVEDEAATTAKLAAAADALEHTDDHDEDASALFDASQYETEELALPTVDGVSVSKIGLNVQGGMIWLERGNAEDVSLVRDLRIGQTVRLLVDVTVGVPKYGYTTNRDGALDVLYRARNVKVDTALLAVSQPAAEGE
jgi:hypothetical protein